MSITSFGDLAMSFRDRAANARMKADLDRLGNELATGVTSNLRAATGGDLGALAGLEASLKTLGSFRVAANEAALFTETLQRAFETVQDTTSDIAPALVQAGGSGQSTLIQAAAVDARARFATVVSVLNTQVAGRSLLAGVATGDPALADSETMLADLSAAIAAETTAAGVEAAVEAWFDTAGGGFETTGYLGSDTTIAPFQIGPDEAAEVTLTAADQDIRDVLKGYAMAALVAEGALSGNHDERVELTARAAERLLTSGAPLAELRAGLGSAEARIETALARNASETSALEIARNGMIAVDPYRTASEFQAVQTQLESLYTITARLSRLSLANYL